MIRKKFLKRLGRELYGFDIRLNGRRIKNYQYNSKKEAEAAVLALRLAEREGQLGIAHPTLERPTLAELIEKRLPTITRRGEHVRSRRVLLQLLSLLPVGIKIHEVTTPHIRIFVERRQQDGQSASSINRELNVIAATLNSAETYYPALAQWVAPRMPRPKTPRRGRERLISSAEIEALLEHLFRPRQQGEQLHACNARRRVGHILTWALLTGMRHGEIDKLRWEHVDWRGGQIKVTNTKNDSHRYLIITPSMREILEERRKLGQEFVFNAGGNTNPKFYRILRDACEACGIPYGRKALGGLTLHDARHTATTRMLQSGIDLATIGSITGHRSRALVLYYSHATVESRAKAADALEESIKKRTG